MLCTVVAIHSRHCLPAVPSPPDHRASRVMNICFCRRFTPVQRSICLHPGPFPPLEPYNGHILQSSVGWLPCLRCCYPYPTLSRGGGITQGPPTPSLHLFSTTLLQGRTPAPFLARVHACIFNLPHPDLPPYSRHGHVVWSMEYGYPSRHLSLWLDTKMPVGHRQAALWLVMQRALSLEGIPPRHSYADITVALLEVDLHKKTAWATLLV